MSGNWTPGPWKLRKAYLDDDLVEIVPRKVRGKASPEYGSWAELATVQIEYTDSAPKANAHLIAAAPDMAEALEACIASLERADTAEGVCCCGDSMDRHSDPMSCGHSPVDMGDYYASNALEAARAALAKARGEA